MSPQRAVYVAVFDGFADWEPAHALAELRRRGRRTVRSVGFNHERRIVGRVRAPFSLGCVWPRG